MHPTINLGVPPQNEESARDDERVAAVVPTPGNDDDAFFLGRPGEELTDEHVARPAACVLHEHDGRRPTRSRVVVERAHRFGGVERLHVGREETLRQDPALPRSSSRIWKQSRNSLVRFA